MKKECEYTTKALIDLKAFKHNINIIRKKYPSSKIILPVKANAYGHNDIIISKNAEILKIDYLCCARVCEAIKLRKNKIKLPIIILGLESGYNIELCCKYNIELSVSSKENIIEIEQIAKKLNKKVKIHLKVDTGMTRLGCIQDEAIELARIISKSKYLLFTSFYSHFARSDDDKEFTKKQLQIFLDIKEKLIKNNLKPDFFHISNSGAIFSDLNIDKDFGIRPGISAYGYSPYKNNENLDLIPVMNLVSKVIFLKKVKKNTGVGYNHTYVTDKDTILATIPAGYGDGIPRILSNKFQVTINNKNYYQRGTISMDLMVIEVDENVKIGDNVYIFGNKNLCCNDAKDLATLANTISYEITTRISERVKREIIN